MPARGLAELVVPGGVVGLHVVVCVVAVVEGVIAHVNIVQTFAPGVAGAGVEGGPGVGLDPWRHVASGREADLHHPVIAQLRGHIDPGLRVAIEGVSERVAISIIIGGELRLDIRQRDVAADANVHALRHLRHIQIDISHRQVEAVLLVLAQ